MGLLGTVLFTFITNIIFIINIEAFSEERIFQLKKLNNVVSQLRAVIHYYENKRELHHGNKSSNQISWNERSGRMQKYLDELSEEEGRFYKSQRNNMTSLERKGDWTVNRAKEENIIGIGRDSIIGIKDLSSGTSAENKMFAEAVRSQKLLSMWYQDELENEGKGNDKSSIHNDHTANETFSYEEYFNERHKNEIKSDIDKILVRNKTLQNSGDNSRHGSANKTTGFVNKDDNDEKDEEDNITLNEQSNHISLNVVEKGKETNRSTMNKQGNHMPLIKDFSKGQQTNRSLLHERVNHIPPMKNVSKEKETNISTLHEHGNHTPMMKMFFSKEKEINRSTVNGHGNQIPLKHSAKDQTTNRSILNKPSNHLLLVNEFLEDQEINKSTSNEHGNYTPQIKDFSKEKETIKSTLNELVNSIPLIKELIKNRELNRSIGSEHDNQIKVSIKESLEDEESNRSITNEHSNHTSLIKDTIKDQETNRSTVNLHGNHILLLNESFEGQESNKSTTNDHSNPLIKDSSKEQETNRSTVNEHDNHSPLTNESLEDQDTKRLTMDEHSNIIPQIADLLEEKETNKSTLHGNHIPIKEDISEEDEDEDEEEENNRSALNKHDTPIPLEHIVEDQAMNRSTVNEHGNNATLINDVSEDQDINKPTAVGHIPLNNVIIKKTNNSTSNDKDIHIHIRIKNHGKHIPSKHLGRVLDEAINRFTVNKHSHNHIQEINGFLEDQETNKPAEDEHLPLHDLPNEKSNNPTLNENDIHILDHINDLTNWYRPQSVRAEHKFFHNLTEGQFVNKVVTSLKKESAHRVENAGKKYLNSLHEEEAHLNELLGMISSTDGLNFSTQNPIVNNTNSNNAHYDKLTNGSNSFKQDLPVNDYNSITSPIESQEAIKGDDERSKDEYGGAATAESRELSATTENKEAVKEVKHILDAINIYPEEPDSRDELHTKQPDNNLPLHQDIRNENNSTNDNKGTYSAENEAKNLPTNNSSLQEDIQIENHQTSDNNNTYNAENEAKNLPANNSTLHQDIQNENNVTDKNLLNNTTSITKMDNSDLYSVDPYSTIVSSTKKSETVQVNII